MDLLQFQPMIGNIYESGVCTLPRQHWPSQSVQTMSMTMSPPMLYAGLSVVNRNCPGGTSLTTTKDCETRIGGQCCVQSQKDGTSGTPVMMTKRESSVWPYTHHQEVCTVCSVSELLWDRCRSHATTEKYFKDTKKKRRIQGLDSAWVNYVDN